MIRVTKYFVILLHLGYVSSYDLYVFALCAEAFGQDLPKSKIAVKIPIEKRAHFCQYKPWRTACAAVDLSSCKVHKHHEVYLVSDVTLCSRCQRLNKFPGTCALVPTGLDLLSSAQVFVIVELNSHSLQMLILPLKWCSLLVWNLALCTHLCNLWLN